MKPQFPKRPRSLRTDDQWVRLQERMIAALTRILTDAGWEIDPSTENKIEILCIDLTHEQVEDDQWKADILQQIERVAAEVEAEQAGRS